MKSVPPIIHLVNLTALLLIGIILVLAAVDREYQLVIVLPILVAIIVYWRLRTNPQIAASYFGISLAVLFWIILCENIVTIDNTLGTHITTRLGLGVRLLAYADAKLKVKRTSLQPCCDDPMSMHYQPGSTYEEAFDCATCNAPYKGVVDETGYMNQPRGFWASHDQIDLFIAGDSVLQGLGVPSVIEWLRDQLPVTMWNLSIAGYGPRQKISALMAYALPKRPKWLVVEFYAFNDLADALQSDVCEGTHDFRCAWSIPERWHRWLRHPIYSRLIDDSADIMETLNYYAAQNFTLATTRYLTVNLKESVKHGLITPPAQDVPKSEANSEGLHSLNTRFPVATLGIPIRPEKALEYMTAGMAVTYHSYERLVATLAKMEHPPTVILLYNPSPYELYRGISMDQDPARDRLLAYQLEAQRWFAKQQGWRFLDLTVPLRQELQVSRAWIFGRYDQSHWSPQGTAMVAAVLKAALLPVIGH